jgi:hypothetical protein
MLPVGGSSAQPTTTPARHNPKATPDKPSQIEKSEGSALAVPVETKASPLRAAKIEKNLNTSLSSLVGSAAKPSTPAAQFLYAVRSSQILGSFFLKAE